MYAIVNVGIKKALIAKNFQGKLRQTQFSCITLVNPLQLATHFVTIEIPDEAG